MNFLKMTPMSLLVVLLVGTLCVQGKPHPQSDSDALSDDDYLADYDSYDEDSMHNNEEEEEVIQDMPNFVSKGSTFTVDKGTTIRLPCYVDKLPKHFVLMWKKISADLGEQFLALDMKVQGKDPRISVEVNRSGPNVGSTLVIGLGDDQDSGQYICEMAGLEEAKIKHTVKIRAPPSIEKKPANGMVMAQKGDSVTLSCLGKGNPEPTITWTRLRHALPGGETSLQGTELTFVDVNRHHSGTYVCTADNGFGTGAKDKIHLDVEYAPEVEVEEVFIHAKEGNKVELVCNVHAHPAPTVKWFKNAMQLTNETQTLKKNKNRHTLTINNISKDDFGNYTCRANNRNGEASRVLEISGKAGFADFKSLPKGYEPTTYLIEWTSRSHTPVEEFELLVREHGSGEDSWQKVQVEPHQQDHVTYAGKHSLRELGSATRYEAKVAAKNEDGWSRHSKVFHFATFGADVEPEVKDEPVTDAATGGKGGAGLFGPAGQVIFCSILTTIFAARRLH